MIYLTVACISLAVALVESISYLGWFFNHFYVHSIAIYAIGLGCTVFITNYPIVIKNIFKYISFSLGIIFFALIFLENITYPNFVFTNTHLNPSTLEIFMTLAWFHYLMITKNGFLKSLLIALIVFISVGSAGKTLGIAYKGIKNIISDPFATYNQKMTKAYPGFYPAMMQVKHLTPDNSTILIPPQANPWEVEGNMAMVNYFLYPRTVANLDITKIDSLSANTYILIAKGSWPRTGKTDYGWPKVSVQSSKIWKFDISHGNSEVYIKDYDPQRDNFDWGLIEVRND